MFASPEFEDAINRFSLRFHQRELEAAFQRYKKDDYIKGRIITTLVVATQVAIITMSLSRNFIPPPSPVPQFDIAFLYGVYYFGSVCELLINFTGKFLWLRTALPCVTAFFVTAMLNRYIDAVPNFRPAYSAILRSLEHSA